MLRIFYQSVLFGSVIFCSTIFYNSANANPKTYLPSLHRLSTVCKNTFFEGSRKQTTDLPCVINNAWGNKDSMIIQYPGGEAGYYEIVSFFKSGKIGVVYSNDLNNVVTGKYRRKGKNVILTYVFDGAEESMEIPINPQFSWGLNR